VEAVSFDVDGTLYRPGPRVFLRVALRVGAARGFRLTYRAREATRGRAFPTGDLLREAVVAELASRSGTSRGEAEALLARVRDNLTPAVLRGMASRDARQALLLLRGAGVRTVALSDEDTALKLAALGLPRDVFDVVHAAEDSGAYKPWPRSFEQVAEMLGVAPAKVVHVGDRPETDGVGALRAGMVSAVLAPAQAPQGAVRVESLRALAQAVVAGRR
jgi:putative hydrolase of the HAD superfamily